MKVHSKRKLYKGQANEQLIIIFGKTSKKSEKDKDKVYRK